MARRFRVGIDGRAFASPAAGVRRYVRHLALALLDLGEPLDLVALGGDATHLPRGLAHEAESRHPPTNLGWTLVGLPAAARRAGVDLIHAPAYTAPFVAHRPVVVTIHDVSYERHPEVHPYRRDWIRRWFYRRSARAAAHVLTDSNFSASEIAAAYGIPQGHITVAPLGVSPLPAPAGTGAWSGPTVGVPGPFLLHVGDLHERRNLMVVVEALLAARRCGGVAATLTLVLAGVDRGAGDALRARMTDAGAPEALVQLGLVDDGHLEQLYRAALALVYPSRYEGFGLPVLEAMAGGLPVVASQAASIPEVLGDAGLLLDPSDTGAWTDALVRIVHDDAMRLDMRARGLARARTFTWARTARMTYEVYRRVAGAGA